MWNLHFEPFRDFPFDLIYISLWLLKAVDFVALCHLKVDKTTLF